VELAGDIADDASLQLSQQPFQRLCNFELEIAFITFHRHQSTSWCHTSLVTIALNCIVFELFDAK